MDIETAVEAGDIVRQQWPGDAERHINLYLGSGRCGGCFDAWGLMNADHPGRSARPVSRTMLMHADVWERGAWGLDYWRPLVRLVHADAEPDRPQAYRQHQRLLSGRIQTHVRRGPLQWTITAMTRPDRPDQIGLRVQWQGEGSPPSIALVPVASLHGHYNQHVTGDLELVGVQRDRATVRTRLGGGRGAIALRLLGEGATASGQGHRLRIDFADRRGDVLVLLVLGGADRAGELERQLQQAEPTPEAWSDAAAGAWRRRWGQAFVHVEDPTLQAMWARSMFYVLSSYGPDVRSPAAPMGWSANVWPFHFPQDVSYIHPALLRTGHHDIARAIAEFYRDRLDNMRDATRRIYSVPGVMWAWEFPIGPDSQLLRDGTPNAFQFEIHNAAYPVRMAYETGLHLRDPAWMREVAAPIARESARFYASIATRERDGRWSLFVRPSMGQDEMGGADARNYLCALFSARYCFQTLARLSPLIDDAALKQQCEAILRDGLAFERLRDANTGLLATCEGLAGASQLGRQKHPVQLNPLLFLPMDQAPDADAQAAYRQRYRLCRGMSEQCSYGWTLAAFWLASSHMGDAAGLDAGLRSCPEYKLTDRDWIQLFEGTPAQDSPFYVTSHGLWLQAMQDAVVSDYWGTTQIGHALPPSWGRVTFHDLRTADGRTHSGTHQPSQNEK